MKLADIIQMQKDRSNGVVLSQISIDKLIGHALMRECEAPHLYERIRLLEEELRSTKALLSMATEKGGSMNKIKTLDERIEETTHASVTIAEQFEMLRTEVAELTELKQAQVRTIEEKDAEIAAERHAFKNFHRMLCERFGYTHDDVDWKRDQVSLMEAIAQAQAPVAAMPEGCTTAEMIAAAVQAGVPQEGGGFYYPFHAEEIGYAIKAAIAAAPQQHAQAVHQFRTAGAADWYDGYPDNEDGGGPYEVRTLYRQQHAQAAQPKQRHVYDWLHLVETQIGTPTAAAAARVLKEFYEGAEPDPAPAQPIAGELSTVWIMHQSQVAPLNEDEISAMAGGPPHNSPNSPISMVDLPPLSADQIEELMPENKDGNGAFPCDECGWVRVSAQWLHDFANNVHRATRQPVPVISHNKHCGCPNCCQPAPESSQQAKVIPQKE